MRVTEAMTIPHGRSTARPACSRRPRSQAGSAILPLAWLAGPLLGATIGTGLGATAALAGPMHCITTLEAPVQVGVEPTSGRPGVFAPVEVTRCAPVQTVTQLLDQRAFTWSAPFATGVDVLHQATDLFGIAMGGADGRRLMGLGFQDQALIWDGDAIEKTISVMLQMQSDPNLVRTADLGSVFTTSLGDTQAVPPAARGTTPQSGRAGRSSGTAGLRAPAGGLW